MRHKKVSVIMGVYNAEKTISACLDSIINQTYLNWEFIICDDCSTDCTVEIIKQYEQKDSRIKLIQNESNLKLAASLNNCLARCQGEYIARMDGDDISFPDRFQIQVDFLDQYPEFAVVGTAVRVFDGKHNNKIRTAKQIPTKDDVLRGPTFMHPTIMMRKEVYEDLQGYTVSKRTQRGQDWDLWFRFFYKGHKGFNIQEPYLQYHESAEDFKKRTLKTTCMYVQTLYFGLTLLQVPFYRYLYLLKPIVSFIVPDKLKKLFSNRR